MHRMRLIILRKLLTISRINGSCIMVYSHIYRVIRKSFFQFQTMDFQREDRKAIFGLKWELKRDSENKAYHRER